MKEGPVGGIVEVRPRTLRHEQSLRPTASARVRSGSAAKLGYGVGGHVDCASHPLARALDEVLSVPHLPWAALGDCHASGTSDEICHLDERMDRTVLQRRAPDEPSLPATNIRLTSRKGSIKTVGADVLCGADRRVATVEHRECNPRPRSPRLLDEQHITHPEPQAIRIDRRFRPHPNDLSTPRATAQMVANKVAPTSLRASEYSSRNQEPRYDPKSRLSGLIQKRDVVLVAKPRHRRSLADCSKKH